MAYVEELSGSKLKSKLGSTLNEAVAMGPNRFAQSQLERMGWSSGEGLGKNRQGIQTHVRIQTRDEQAGLGHASSTNDNHGWWNDSMGKIFSKLQQTTTTKVGKTKKLTKTKKTKKKEKMITSSSISTNPITDEDLFLATGGKRFGMRAQRKQIGKWARTESNLSTQEEEEVKKKLEWNGRGQATVVLTSNQQSTITTESSTSIHDNQNNHDRMTLSREDSHNPTTTTKQEKKKARRSKQKELEQKENSSSDRPKKEKKRKRDAAEN